MDVNYPYHQLLIAMGVLVAASAAIVSAAWFILRDPAAAGLSCVISMLALMYYGPIHEIVFQVLPLRNNLFMPLTLLVCGGLAFGFKFALRGKPAIGYLQVFLTLMSATYVVFMFSSVSYTHARRSIYLAHTDPAAESAAMALPLTRPDNPPNIYFLLFDEMTSIENVESYFGVDLSAQKEKLESLGLKVCTGARSPYPKTAYVMPMIFNPSRFDRELHKQLAGVTRVPADTMDFVNEFLYPKVNESGQSAAQAVKELFSPQKWINSLFPQRWNSINAWEYIIQNEAAYSLQNIGYRTVFLDQYHITGRAMYGRGYSIHIQNFGRHHDNNYFRSLLNPSVISVFISLFGHEQPQYVTDLWPEVRNAMQHEVASPASPQFVHMHAMIPHTPFVLDESCKKIPEGSGVSFMEGYRGQYTYALNQLIAVAERITQEDPRAILVIQGDHGLRIEHPEDIMNNRPGLTRDLALGIFYAIRLPDGGNADIPDDFSPLNTFRVIFNRYFGAHYSMAVQP